MKKFFYLFSVLALGSLLTAGTLWAGPVTQLCPKHGRPCVEKAAGMYCNLSEEIMVNKLVPGRAGQWGWVRMPTFREASVECPGME